MDVSLQTQLYAQYSSANFGRGTTEAVADLQDAVNKGLEMKSPRFKTFEKSFVEIDGEVLEGKPKNPSADIYLGVDQVYYLSDIINRHKLEIMDLQKLPASGEAQLSRQFTIQALESVVRTLSAKNPQTRFISEKGQRGDFIELKEGETVFDSKGQQLWPELPGQDTVLRIQETGVLPASDAEREYTWEDEKFDNEMAILSRQL